jgi:thioredoxin
LTIWERVVTETEFLDRLRSNPRPMVVDVWAAWCLPCRAIEPSLRQLAREFDGRVELLKVNADEQPDLVRALGVRGIPTLIGFNNGTEVSRQTGARPLSELRALFETALTGRPPLPRRGLLPMERTMRSLAGLALLLVGWLAGPSIPLLGLGGIVLFSAIYDRCPVWQALAPRLSAAFRRGGTR